MRPRVAAVLAARAATAADGRSAVSTRSSTSCAHARLGVQQPKATCSALYTSQPRSEPRACVAEEAASAVCATTSTVPCSACAKCSLSKSSPKAWVRGSSTPADRAGSTRRAELAFAQMTQPTSEKSWFVRPGFGFARSRASGRSTRGPGEPSQRTSRLRSTPNLVAASSSFSELAAAALLRCASMPGTTSVSTVKSCVAFTRVWPVVARIHSP
eukprot:3166178-Prymnesium_polylepis.1